MSNTATAHPICKGRKIYVAADFKDMLQNRSDHVITAVFNSEMAVVRQNVKELCRERDMMDSYVAQMLGWDKTQYSKWMNEPERNLSLTAAIQLCTLLGCTLNELIMGESKPVKLPKLSVALYEIIRSKAALHAECDKMMVQIDDLTIEDLVYARLQERADDKNEDLYQMIVKWNAELKQVAFRLLRNKKFIGRLPMVYAICVCTEDSPDFLLQQNIAHCNMTANGKLVEDRYKQTLGRFVSLSTENQHKILATLINARYF